MVHPQTLTYSIPFSCLECLSTVPPRCAGPNKYATARDIAVAADRVWDLRQSAPTAPVAAAYQPRERSASPRQRSRNFDCSRDSDRGRSQSQRRGRAQTPHDQEFPDNGICW